MSVLTDCRDDLFKKLTEQQASLGLIEIFHGDQRRIPHTPVACVVPEDQSRALKGANRYMLTSIVIYIIIYHSKIGSVHDNQKEADDQAADVVELIDKDATLEGKVIHGFCSHIESGQVDRNNSLMRATRITYEAEAREILP